MCLKLKLFCLLSLTLIYKANAFTYEFDPDPTKLLQRCENVSENVLALEEAIDMTHMTVQSLGDDHSIRFSGNMTMQWKGVEHGDTVTFLFQLLEFDKNSHSWKPSIFKTDSKNICPEVFGKNKYWYQYFTKHIINKDEVEDKCISVHGLVIQYETFDILLKGNLGFVPNLAGPKKLFVLFEAFDKNMEKRPYSFCTEVVGEVRQL